MTGLNFSFKFIRDYKLINRNKKRQSILDVGCGSGEFLQFCKKKGMEVYGVEKSGYARKICRDKFGIETFESIYCKPIRKKQYDVITMFFVLEHCDDPYKLLCDFKSNLKREGSLVIRVPNIGSLEARIFKSRWFQLQLPSHKFHFDKEGISSLLNKAGYEIAEMNTNFTRQSAISVPCSIFPFLDIFSSPEASSSRGSFVTILLTILVFIPFSLIECAFGVGPIITIWAYKMEETEL